jgi:hypothetical protein
MVELGSQDNADLVLAAAPGIFDQVRNLVAM